MAKESVSVSMDEWIRQVPESSSLLGPGPRAFIGAGPESPNVRMLPIGGPEENEVLSLLERWLDETQVPNRRESLMGTDTSALQGQDLLDRLALEFLLEVRHRDMNR
jgi:hypothetical protein